MPQWLRDAVFYEIYPQTFYDTNKDGIGDIEGIIEKLDYVKELGCNALWINPCFDSPFKDAGYDVRDYKRVAPRYGTNEDLVRLFDTAHGKGIRVLLDLVPGHTSEEHEWFKASGRADKNEYSGRYIWTDSWFKGIGGHPYIGGEAERDGTYMLNFFKCQPALNYGFKEKREPWQTGMDEPDAIATREAIKDVMRFWLDKGCDGFRVDMADSLVKEDDENKSGTCRVWQDIMRMLKEEYPDAAMVSEWSNPYQAINGAGFHMDFYLDHWHNGYNTLFRDYECSEVDNSYFKSDGDGDINRFLEDYLPKYEATRDKGYISFMTCNHDTIRPRYNLTEEELKVAYAFLFTMPGVPFLYYGDEIGLNYIADMPTKEGGYTRTGSRTPMQWTDGVNAGFSEGEPDKLYLPIQTEGAGEFDGRKSETCMNCGMGRSDDTEDSGGVGSSNSIEGSGGVGSSDSTEDSGGVGSSNSTEGSRGVDGSNGTEGSETGRIVLSVESSMRDADSLYHVIKDVLAIRHREENLSADAPFEVVSRDRDKAFVYRRGSIVIVVNPKNRAVQIDEKAIELIKDMEVIYTVGNGKINENNDSISSKSLVIYK